jgi:hypothetical protein
VQDDPVWFSVRTDNHFELARQGAVLWLQTQTRLERLIEAPLVGESLDFAAIRPRDAEQHQLMFEEIRDAERIAAWAAEGRRLWTRLQPNRAERIHHVGADGPLILYRARADAMQVLGRTARILVDRSLASERRLLTDNGQWRLEAIDPGLHEVEVEVDADLAMYVDRARRGASTAFVRRTVVPLGRKKLSIAVRKTTEQSVTLNAIVYDTRSQGDFAPIVEAWVDGGKPRRNTAVPVERITIAQDRWQLSEPLRTSNVEFLSRDLSGPVRVYAVRVHLGADIVAGEHTITVRSNVPHGLWVRFFAATEESSWSDDPGGTQWPLSGGADD